MVIVVDVEADAAVYCLLLDDDPVTVMHDPAANPLKSLLPMPSDVIVVLPFENVMDAAGDPPT